MSKFDQLSPWLDTEKLLPGMEWEEEIMRNIDESQYLILILSQNSVNKVGFFQKEVKKALDRFDHFPTHKRFLIPVRSDKVIVKSIRLKRIQYVDLFQNFYKGIELILRSMEINDIPFSIFEKGSILPSNLNKDEGYILLCLKGESPGFTVKNGRIESILFHGSSLNFVPKTIFELTQIKTLEITRTHLKTLSEDIGKLENLETLILTGNKLQELPKSIGNLEKLKKLYLRDNKISSLPSSISKLTQLEFLDLRQNKFTENNNKRWRGTDLMKFLKTFK